MKFCALTTYLRSANALAMICFKSENIGFQNHTEAFITCEVAVELENVFAETLAADKTMKTSELLYKRVTHCPNARAITDALPVEGEKLLKIQNDMKLGAEKELLF